MYSTINFKKEVNAMNLSEGIQKISFPIIEPHLYVRPILNYVPIEQVNKVYSSENFFNSSTYKEYKEKFANTDSNKKNSDFRKGSIFDLLA